METYKDIEKVKEMSPKSKEDYLNKIASFSQTYGLHREGRVKMRNNHERRAVNAMIQGGNVR